jgi:hypothetical protein
MSYSFFFIFAETTLAFISFPAGIVHLVILDYNEILPIDIILCYNPLMDFPSVINLIDMGACCTNSLIAIIFLSIAIVDRRRCFNFSTLLSCNTALAIFLFSMTNISMSAYMFMWDKQPIPNEDSLCAIRAYFHHSAIAAIHHAFFLQAIEKYFKIRQIRHLNTRVRQLCFVSIQWLYDLTFTLPVLLTGNMTKVSRDNMCLVRLSRLDLVFYLFVSSFILSDTGLIVIYYRLVQHVREVSSHTNGGHVVRNQRDITMVRRIVLLNGQLAAVGSPVCILVIVNTIRADLLPKKSLRVLATIINLSLASVLIVLFWSTPALRRNLTDSRSQTQTIQSMRVYSMQNSAQNHPSTIVRPTQKNVQNHRISK